MMRGEENLGTDKVFFYSLLLPDIPFLCGDGYLHCMLILQNHYGAWLVWAFFQYAPESEVPYVSGWLFCWGM